MRWRGALGRGRAVGLVAGLGLVLFALTLPTWGTASAATTSGTMPVAVSGTDAAPGVAAAALLVVVAGLVLALSGRASRVLAVLGVLAGGVLGVVAARAFLLDPASALEQAAATATGVNQIDGGPGTTAAPVAAVVVAGLLVLVAVALPVLAGTWTTVGRRYETGSQQRRGVPSTASAASGARSTPRRRAMDDWDALSRGDDPSDASTDGDREPPEQGS